MAVLPAFMRGFFDRMRSAPTDPETPIGVSGTVVYSGFVDAREKDPALLGQRRYQTYDELRANVEIIGTCIRYILNLVSRPKWKFEPADKSGKAKQYAESMEEFFDKMDTPMRRVKRSMAMYCFHGFSIHEWTARKYDDGRIGLLDLDVRPQSTIYRWDLDLTGNVIGVSQRSPQTFEELYIPRARILHLVDDAMSDSPEGFGLFRNAVPLATQLQAFERLEGIGYERDLRGIPIGKLPLGELNAKLKSGELNQGEYDKIVAAMKDFVTTQSKNPKTGAYFDSDTYRTIEGNPTATAKWAIELLQGGATSFAEVHTAIERKTTALARLFSCEHLTMGQSRGTQAMHQDKSANLGVVCDSILEEETQGTQKDVVLPLMRLNGWDENLAPSIKSDRVAFRDIAELADLLLKMAQAGAPVMPDDEAVGEIYDQAGLTRPDPRPAVDPMTASLLPGRNGGAPVGGVRQPGPPVRTTPPAPTGAASTNGKTTVQPNRKG